MSKLSVTKPEHIQQGLSIKTLKMVVGLHMEFNIDSSKIQFFKMFFNEKCTHKHISKRIFYLERVNFLSIKIIHMYYANMKYQPMLASLQAKRAHSFLLNKNVNVSSNENSNLNKI